MREAALCFVLFAVGCWLALLHAANATYHPVVQVSSPEGVVYTAVQEATRDRQACGAANNRFLRPLIERCKQCEVAFARCARKLEGLEAALQEDAALPHHRVFASGVRVAIVGPTPFARRQCELIAGDMVKLGLSKAACLYPA